jgi:hypothetical protein
MVEPVVSFEQSDGALSVHIRRGEQAAIIRWSGGGAVPEVAAE